jgi:small subunit ribosomal protein S17
MADEKDDNTTDDTEQAAEAPEAGGAEETAPESVEAGGADEAPAAPEAAQPEAEAPADAEDAPEADADSEATAEEPAADADGEEPAADRDTAGEAPGGTGEPAEELAPKERRRRLRSRHSGEARSQRSPEERHAERVAERKTKAVGRRTRRLRERAKAKERRAGKPAPEPLAPVHAPVEGARRVRQGIVVSDKAEKTITVRIDIARRHRRYEKIVRSSSTVHAHDENNDAHEGDVVRVIESRPLSRMKRWALVDVVERAR